MLTELHVRDLGVIDDLHLVLGPGMTAVTGETGAGKTLVVEAIELLVGGKADPVLVRAGAAEASVEGRFVLADDEVVIRRVVPASGRSRAYRNGAMVALGELGEIGASIVDLHGQHTHQSLLGRTGQRAALDNFAAVDHGPWRDARARLREIDAALAELGGDPRARARELDLLRFQLAEIDGAAITDPGEEAVLEVEEAALADATAHRDAGQRAYAALAEDGGAADGLRAALGVLASRPPFEAEAGRLRDVLAEVDDLATATRQRVDALTDDPEKLELVRARRQLLVELRRKYGATLEEVLAFAATVREQIATLEGHEGRVAELSVAREAAASDELKAATRTAEARRAAAPRAASEIEEHLHALALPGARLEIDVAGDPPGDDVTFLLAANAGEPPLPLTKIASGGELARVMLALRLVLTDGPPTLVFDEVDAGVGGAAAVAVGRSLAGLALRHQVLVVTHLPQVAAFADAQIQVTKQDMNGRAVARASGLDHDARVLELSRMLAGQPDSVSARDHAAELLATASRERRP